MSLTKDDRAYFVIGQIWGVCDSQKTSIKKIERIKEILRDFDSPTSEGTSQ